MAWPVTAPTLRRKVIRVRLLRLGKRWLVILSGVFLLLVLVAPGASVAPFAPESVFCTSSIDPKCQPQNLPILIEAGIISAPGAATTGGGGATAAAVITGTAGTVGVAALVTAGPCLVGTLECQTKATLKKEGWVDVGYVPDHTWTNPAAGTHTLCPNPSLVTQAGLAAAGYPGKDPICDAMRMSGSVPNGILKVDIEGSEASGFTITTEVIDVGAGTEIIGVRVWCYAAGVGAAGSSTLVTVDVGGAATIGATTTDTWTPDPATCLTGGREPMIGIYQQSSPWTASTSMGILYSNGRDFDTPSATDVEVNLRSTVECKDTAGDTRLLSLVGLVSYTIGVAVGQALGFPEAKCDDGEIAIGGELEVSHDGGTSWTKVGEAAAPEVITDLPVEYPLCFSPGAGCKLTLWKITPDGVEFCGSIGQNCAGWNQTPLDLVESMYQCRYGTYVINLRYCSAYRDPSVGILPNVDEEGNPLPIDAPLPGSGGGNPSYVVDPVTGEQVLAPAPEDYENPAGCWPTGWGVVNPFAWVYMPVRCVIEWAFVPRTEVVQAVGLQVRTAWSDTSLAQPAAVVESWAASLPAGLEGSCLGPVLDLNDPALAEYGFSGTYYPLQACDEPLATIAAIARVVLSGSIMLAAAYAIVRYLAATFGYVGVGKDGAAS